MAWKFGLGVALIAGAMGAGYLCRKRGLVDQRLARWLMTFVAVLGYPAVGFLSIWQLRLQPADVWLGVGGAAHIAVMACLGLAMGRLLRCHRQEVGLLGISTGLGNTGFTMGAFVIFLLYGAEGLGLASIVQMLWTPMVVLLTYPIARHYAAETPGGSLARLIARSLLDWRSIGLPLSVAAVFLSVREVPYPRALAAWHAVDAIVYLVLPMAYFSIGLRLHLRDVPSLGKLILALAAGRFGLGLAAGWALLGLTFLSPWPLKGLRQDVFIIEAFVPTAVTAVAVANMFDLRPRQSSVLFVVNTLAYLGLILPIVWVVYG